MNDHGWAPRSKPKLELGKPPVGLHGRPRVAFDRQVAVLVRLDREIVDHEVR